MKKIMITALLALFLSGCDNSPPAPYGFKWGQTKESVKALNLKDTNCNFENSCTFQETPDGHDAAILFTTFHDKLGLFYIFYTENFDQKATTKDEAFELYEQAGNKLQKVYGEPVNKTHIIKDESNFFNCLASQDCGDVNMDFDKDGYKANLRMSVSNQGKTHLIYTFKSPVYNSPLK
ncbi:TPA: hypothetical protein U2M51_000298 [Providencia rettgeri]|nr:hypothetical protein [Providencia rettgeri]